MQTALLASPVPLTGVRRSLGQAVAVFRAVALLFCAYLVVRWRHLYEHVGVAVGVLMIMALVTGVAVWVAVRASSVRPVWIGADVVVTVLLTLATRWAQTSDQLGGGLHSMPTLTTVWAAGPVIEAAIIWRWFGGVVAASVQFAAAVVTRQGYDGRTLSSGVLLVITGALTGYLAALLVRAETQLADAAATQAAVAERERLARSIHDGVLQVLTLVHRTGRDTAPPWGPLAAAAAQQEAALRGMITSAPSAGASGVADLADRLRALRTDRVTVSAPADPVTCPVPVAGEVVAAVEAALHNVTAHAGGDAHAWVALDGDDGVARVTVRDDGRGFAAGRLAEAAADGRLGVSSSIRGRLADLGGTATITSVPGEGTVVELVVPVGERRPS